MGKRAQLDNRLLFVFNHYPTLRTFQAHYRVLGYKTAVAERLSDLARICKDFSPRVVVADSHFPDGTIVDVLTIVEETCPEANVIMMTAFAPPEMMARLGHRLFGCITKPMTMEESSRLIRRAFGVHKPSLDEEMRVRPIWRGRDFEVSEKKCFVLMPFGEAWSTRIWERHLKRIITRCSYVAERADNFTGHDIMEDIWIGINRSRIVLADITGKNPNVFYELGIAHTLGKQVILITQSLKDVPFDINRYRVILYEDNSDGHDRLRRLVTSALKGVSLQ